MLYAMENKRRKVKKKNPNVVTILSQGNQGNCRNDTRDIKEVSISF